MAIGPNVDEIRYFANQQQWQRWLTDNAEAEAEVWIKLAKKNSGADSVSYDQAVETALCFGWVDSQIRRFDEQFYISRFTPRRPKSSWTATNIAKAEQLVAEGRMQPAGYVSIESAKQHGLWKK